MNKATELKTTTDIVKDILERNEDARNSDNVLYVKVCAVIGREHGIDINSMSMPTFLLNLKEHGFPAFETVRRTRQKLQAENEELRASSTVEGFRMLNEEIFREYARGNV